MSKIKRDVEFLVFEDKGVVVCKLHNCKYIASDRINKYFIKQAYLDKYYNCIYSVIDDVFVGVARCASDDKFDLEYGKKLALTRAKAKRGKAVNRAIERYVADIQNSINRLLKEGIHKVPDEKELDEFKEV